VEARREDPSLRLATLERDFLKFRRFAVFAIVVLGAVPLALQYSSQHNVLVGTGLILNDERGEVRVHIASFPRDTRIAIYSDEGKEQVAISVTPYDSRIELSDRDGGTRVSLEGSGHEAKIMLFDDTSMSASGRSGNESATGLELSTSHGRAQLRIGNASRTLDDSGHQLVVINEAGEILFKVP
jgi:hypothetical protein